MTNKARVREVVAAHIAAVFKFRRAIDSQDGNTCIAIISMLPSTTHTRMRVSLDGTIYDLDIQVRIQKPK